MKSRPTRKRAPSGKTKGEGVADPLFKQIVEAFLGDARVSLSRMFGVHGLKAGGKVFAMLVKGRLVVKLPKNRVEALIASGEAEPFDPGHGRMMKEWAAIGYNESDRWLGLAREAKDFADPNIESAMSTQTIK